MPNSIPKGLTREHILRALSDLDTGVEHPFGAPTGYELVHEGKRYPPKAVAGLAFRHLARRKMLTVIDDTLVARPWAVPAGL